MNRLRGVFRRAAGIAGVLTLLAAAPAVAAPSSAFMPAGAEVEPPFGYFDFCHRDAGNCPEYASEPAPRPDTRAKPFERGRVGREKNSNQQFWDRVFDIAQAEATEVVPVADAYPVEPRAARVVVAMTPDLWRRVHRLNRSVNSAILPRPDIQSFGRQDFWAPPLARGFRRFGDCEDYVLEKRRLLIAAGVPPEALSIATARLRRNDLHAVLLLATPDGDLVLDNRSAWISPWYALGYRWERRQVSGGQAWARVHA